MKGNMGNEILGMVKQSDARILRETLARLASLPQCQAMAVSALTRYGRAVGVYCSHPEYSYLAHEGMNACLDCGKRFPKIEQMELPLK